MGGCKAVHFLWKMQEPITIYWPSRLGLNGIADLTEGHLRAQVVSLGKEEKKKIISGSKGLDFYAKLWNGWTCPKTGKWYPIILSDSKEKLKGLKKLLLEKVATVVCFHFSLGFFSPPKRANLCFDTFLLFDKNPTYFYSASLVKCHLRKVMKIVKMKCFLLLLFFYEFCTAVN